MIDKKLPADAEPLYCYNIITHSPTNGNIEGLVIVVKIGNRIEEFIYLDKNHSAPVWIKAVRLDGYNLQKI